MRLAVPLLTCAALAVFAPAASAADKTAPPGNSGISQYLQVVPSASGPKKPQPPAKNRGALTEGQRRRLVKSGADGRTLARLVASTAPIPASASTGAGKSKSDTKPQSASSSVARSVAGSGGTGLGIALPILMVGAVVGAVAITILRRRRPKA
jgi:hypothetical protein